MKYILNRGPGEVQVSYTIPNLSYSIILKPGEQVQVPSEANPEFTGEANTLMWEK